MKKLLIISVVTLSFLQLTYGIELPNVYGNHMVLQQQDSVVFQGWCITWETIYIETSWGEFDSTLCTNEMNWSLKIKTPEGGFEPQTIWIRGKTDTIILKDILIGEVWLCSGQSNMQWSANNGIENTQQEISEANYPYIRFLQIGLRSSPYPQDNLVGEWTVCSPETMQDFSAIGYFFGREIQRDLQVPVGLIQDAWGGTPIEVHYSAASLKDKPELLESAEKFKSNLWGPFKLGYVYNAMTYPLKDFSIAGMLWYQGESNVHDPDTYAKKLENLIHERRKQCKANIPLYYVQIAPYNYEQEQDSEIIRDQQRMADKSIENVGMVVVSDIGDTLDIHPKRKKEVGERLSRLALKHHYGTIDQEVVVDFPDFKSAILAKKRVAIEFSNCQGLYFREGDKGYFEVAGAESDFVSVDAKVKDDKVYLKVADIKDPKYVRFAMSNKATPLLFNGSGLPASCFGTQPVYDN